MLQTVTKKLDFQKNGVSKIRFAKTGVSKIGCCNGLRKNWICKNKCCMQKSMLRSRVVCPLQCSIVRLVTLLRVFGFLTIYNKNAQKWTFRKVFLRDVKKSQCCSVVFLKKHFLKVSFFVWLFLTRQTQTRNRQKLELFKLDKFKTLLDTKSTFRLKIFGWINLTESNIHMVSGINISFFQPTLFNLS